MSSIKNIAIIGAGVAGLALAIFARKQGIKVTLFERNTSFSTIGAGVTLWPNATFVLEQLGLIDDFTQCGGQPVAMRQYDKQATQLGEFNIQTLNSLCGFPTISILRRDLIKILAERLEKLGATIHFNQAVNTQDIAQLKDKFDLVVGCDGRMQSKAREYLYKVPMPTKYQGFINIIGTSKIDLTPFEQTIHDFRDNNERFGIVPVANQHCYWAAAWPSNLDKTKPMEQWFEEMHERFQDWPKKVQQVLNSYNPRSLKRIFVHDIDPLPYWHKENLIIIGDAAHASLPTSGQGASQALEDAWHLAQLFKTEFSLNVILKKFYETRIHKTSSAQNMGRLIAQHIFQQSSNSATDAPSISAEELSQLYMQGLDLTHTK